MYFHNLFITKLFAFFLFFLFCIFSLFCIIACCSCNNRLRCCCTRCCDDDLMLIRHFRRRTHFVILRYLRANIRLCLGESFAELHHGAAAPTVPSAFHQQLVVHCALLSLLLLLLLLHAPHQPYTLVHR